jgi:phosphate transport system permease protein
MAKRQFVRVVFEGDSVSAPPSKWETLSDQVFKGTTWFCTLAIILLLFFILYEIGKEALPSMGTYGVSFLTTQTWDANTATFGILPQIWGTLYSSFLALLIGGVFGVAVAVFLTQDFLPEALQAIFKNIVELLAAIPSVVYGLWGIFVLIPLIRPYCDWIYAHFSWIPFFGTTLPGPGPPFLIPSIKTGFKSIKMLIKMLASFTTRWAAAKGSGDF